jgi:outer membrane protein OmpA-like peptidoglycan-associated protein
MLRLSPPLIGAAALAALASGLSAPATAQSDPAALQLIEQLRPRAGSGTRGIRMPSAAETPAPAPAAPVAAPAAAAPVAAPASRPAPRPAPAAAVAAAATPAPAGAASVSITVTFPTGSATLTSEAEQALAPLGQALSSPQLAPYRFRIEGHTDTVGDAGTNQRLSERRAQAVREYLVQRYGVTPSRLEALGLGESRPVVATPDNTDEPRNRRVQVVNLDG